MEGIKRAKSTNAAVARRRRWLCWRAHAVDGWLTAMAALSALRWWWAVVAVAAWCAASARGDATLLTLREAPDNDGHCQVWPADVMSVQGMCDKLVGKRVYVFEGSGTIAEQIVKLDGMIAKLLQMANSVAGPECLEEFTTMICESWFPLVSGFGLSLRRPRLRLTRRDVHLALLLAGVRACSRACSHVPPALRFASFLPVVRRVRNRTAAGPARAGKLTVLLIRLN